MLLKRQKIKWLQRLFGIVLPSFGVVLLSFGVGCAPKAGMKVLVPAEIDTTGIRTVAVGSFEIVEVQEVSKTERDGRWKVSPIPLSNTEKKALSKQIRARVINRLNTVPYFKIQFTDEFENLANDENLQELVSAVGYRKKGIDAVISGKVWLSIQRVDGVENQVLDLEYTQNKVKLEMDRLAWYPYKSVRGSLALEAKLTRLNPTEIVAVSFAKRGFSQKVDGASSSSGQSQEAVLPSLDQVVTEMATSVSSNFVKRISVGVKEVYYEIAEGGDSSATLLIQIGAYRKALERLNKLLDQESKHPDDLYNQGLCYEAIGEYGIAQISYEEAFQLEPTTWLYSQALGRIETLRRQYPTLRQQLANKKK